MATVVLGAVGTMLGGPIGGAIGAMLGQAVDSRVLMKPGGVKGPRLQDLHVQTSTYGTQVPAVFGTMRVAGTVIWATDLHERRKKSGGGKGKPKVTSCSYSTSFAVALSCRPIKGVGRIWADGKLLRGLAGDFKSGVNRYTHHLGGADQPVHPVMAAALGIAATPAHRGMAFAMFQDLQLEDFGNRIPSLSFEVFADDGDVGAGAMAAALSGGAVMAPDAADDVALGGFAASGADIGEALSPLVQGLGFRLKDAQDGAGGMVLTGDATLHRRIDIGTALSAINGRAVERTARTREPAEQAPARMALRYYEPARDYQAGMQQAVRPGPGRRDVQIDLPVALTAGRARYMAQRRLTLDWKGRERMEVVLGWQALTIAPGSVIGLDRDGVPESGSWIVRAREWEAMGVRLSLQRTAGDAAVDLPASPGTAVGAADMVHGPTLLMVLDLPNLGDSAAATPQIVVAACGEGAGWRSAALFTVEGTAEAMEPIGATAEPATMGHVSAVPGAGSATLFDDINSLDVTLAHGAMDLSGADDAALLRGANLCMAGQELIQFGRAVQTGPRDWRLSRLLRGRRGSEWAMAAHQPGEPFLMIEAETLAAIPPEAVQTGATLRLAAIGLGDVVPAEAQMMVTGEAVRPPSPVALRVRSDGAGGLSIGWTRRSRAGWSWLDGVDAPLAEEAEAYRIEIWRGATLVRSAESATPHWTYSAAMIGQDGPAPPGMETRIAVMQRGSLGLGRALEGVLP